MVHHFQQVRERSHYSEVCNLDDALLDFIKQLPPCYSMQPDNSLGHSPSYVPVHRFLLITEILFVRISLHRPYLLRRLNSDRYARSRNACFDSAMKDFEVRQAFRKTTPKEVRDSLGNAYREFQAAMISGIYFVLEPGGRHSDAMHAILDEFMKSHEGMKEMDETTKRELKIIEFFKARALQQNASGIPRRRGSEMYEDHPSRKEQQAQLLLSLQKPLTSPPTKNLLLSTSKKESLSPKSPPLSRPLAQSPSFKRLQHPIQPLSPTTSGSPHAEDENPAQTLLDTWYNSLAVDPGSAPSPWSGTEVAGWAGIPFSSNTNPDPRLISGLDGSDYAYWEALVNQIQPDAQRLP